MCKRLLLLCALTAGQRAGGMTDPELRNWVAREYPAIRTAPDDWARVQILREFSYRHTNSATGVDTAAYAAGAKVVNDVWTGKMTVGDGYRFFDKNGGGVVCGGTAEMLAKLYRAFGFGGSWIIRIGWATPTPLGSNFGHVQTLVRIKDRGNLIYVVNDAVTNSTYTRSDGRSPLDYRDMLYLLAQNRADLICTIAGLAGSRQSPPARTVGFYADQPDFKVGLGSCSVDPNNFTVNPFPLGWYFESPRRLARFETLGDRWWKPQLVREGRPGETIYLHTFLVDIQSPSGIDAEAQRLMAESRRILNDFRTLHFAYGEGFRSLDFAAINAAAASYGVKFSTTNTPVYGPISLYPAPESRTHRDAALCFFPDSRGDVAGRIDFLRPVSQVDLDVTYFNGSPVTMAAYDNRGHQLGLATSVSRLSVAAPGGADIQFVTLRGNSNHQAINIDNLRVRKLEDLLHFRSEDGFRGTTPEAINAVAAASNVQFSVANKPTWGPVTLYPDPTTYRDVGLVFFPDAAGQVKGKLSFTFAVSGVELDVTYFNGGSVLMTAYDEAGSALASTQGKGHLAIPALADRSRRIRTVLLRGAAGGANINIDNVHMRTWLPLTP
jgi:hypothetical protein